MKFKICMYLFIIAVLLEENSDSIENLEDNLVCWMFVIVMVVVYWERKMSDNRRCCNFF